MAGPIGVKKLTPRFINPLIGMGTEVIPVRLQQIRRKPLAAIAVIISKRTTERRYRDTRLDSTCNNLSPALLIFFNGRPKIFVQQQIL